MEVKGLLHDVAIFTAEEHLMVSTSSDEIIITFIPDKNSIHKFYIFYVILTLHRR